MSFMSSFAGLCQANSVKVRWDSMLIRNNNWKEERTPFSASKDKSKDAICNEYQFIVAQRILNKSLMAGSWVYSQLWLSSNEFILPILIHIGIVVDIFISTTRFEATAICREPQNYFIHWILSALVFRLLLLNGRLPVIYAHESLFKI